MALPDSHDPAAAAGPGPTLRSVLSLAIFIHFFCVAVALSSTYLRSALQSRLVAIFGPYTELMAFDPGQGVPYYYTHARFQDEDATLAIDLYADGELPVAGQPLQKTVGFPERQSPWLGERQRAIRLVRRLAIYAESDEDELSGEIARGIGARVMRENGARRAVVHCLRHTSQPLGGTNEPEKTPPLYEADVWFDEDGRPLVLRRVSAAESAPRTGVRGQESGVRSQRSGLGGRESGVGETGKGASP